MDAHHVQRESINKKVSYPFTEVINKPVMIYYFVDPFCPNCWHLERYIRKLSMEYAGSFNVRPIIGHTFSAPKYRSPEKQLAYHYLQKHRGLIGIKAAALQGNKKGRDFLRAFQESVFFEQQKEITKEMLCEVADSVGLDLHEYQSDIQSISAKKAYKSDLQLAREMYVMQYPTLVFSSQYVEDYSIKISDLQHYETYAFVLEKMLGHETVPVKVLPIIDYIKKYRRVEREEIAFIYDISLEKAEKELKRLQLMQKVQKRMTKDKMYWEYLS